MTVAADYTPKLYTANGTTTVFPWTADYDSTYGTLIVTEVNASGETVQTYVEGTDYNIQGKEVVFVTAPATGELFAPSGIHGFNRKYISNVEVETTDWASDNTYTDYPYKASVDLDFIAADAIPSVCFSLEDATSGEFAPVCDYNGTTGYLTIYAKNVPNGDITIGWVKLEW